MRQLGIPQDTGIDARPGGSGTGKPLYSQKQINAAIDNCAQSYFNVRLDSFNPTSRGHSGTFNGTDLDTNSNVTVVNDVRTFSMAGLGKLSARFGGPGTPIVGGTPIFRPDIQAACYTPYRNYTGNDVRGWDPVVRGLPYREGTQIWELGNRETGVRPAICAILNRRRCPCSLIMKAVRPMRIRNRKNRRPDPRS